MARAHLEAPSAQIPVPLLLNRMNGVRTNAVPEYVYVKVRISTAILAFDTEERLMSCGLECISPGEPSVVYGIIPNSREPIDDLLNDPDVLTVELSEPAAGK